MHTQKFVLPAGHPLSTGYAVVCCETCGFVFADTAATQRDYDLFYATFSKYEDAQTGTGGGESGWDAKRLGDTARDVSLQLPSRDARILDVGCANGGLLGALQKEGYRNLVGVDPSPVCATNTKRKFGIESFAASIYALPDLGTFDCVILSHVMEHLFDLAGAAKVATKALSPDGLLYVEVPDASRYVDCLFAPFQDFNTEHINHFSHRGLANLFASVPLLPVLEKRKDIESAQNVPYPALYTFFRQGTLARPPEKDTELRLRIIAYIEASAAMMRDMDATIAGFLGKHSRIIVWGAGQLLTKLLAETCLADANIRAFVDSNPLNQGKFLGGIPIVAPEQIREHGDPILIASTIHQTAIAEMIENKLQLPNPILFLR